MTHREKLVDCIEASDAAVDAGEDLYSDWEINFLESVSKQAEYRGLSPSQITKLRELHEKACASNF